MADVEEIKKRLDIVQVVGEYLTLKKAGVTYKALCPFHSEKTPSFTVSPERQTWHCFGCSEGGDVISFVQKIDGLEFYEALEKLAGKVGIQLKPEKPRDIHSRNDKTKIYEVLELATRLYHSVLLQHQSAQVARQYLEKRGVSEAIITQFRLGYAPNAWHTIEQLLAKKNIPIDLAWKSGLAVKREGGKGIYDRFRDRLLFPIDDASGKITGFTGRILGDDPTQAKYLNTSESPVFKKSESLYALSFARSAIRANNLAVFVEGQMDCLAAHQFGFVNTIASSGTALTIDHLRLMKRYTNTVAFAFDNDAAGKKAARGAASLAFSLEMNPLMVTIPIGKDPDECIRNDANEWKKAVSRAEPAINYFLKQELSEAGALTAIRKKTISQTIFPLVKMVTNAVEQTEYLKYVAENLGVAEKSLLSDFNQKPTVVSAKDIIPKIKSESPALDLERQLIGLALAYFSLLTELPPLELENKALGSIYNQIRESIAEQKSLEQVLRSVPEEWRERLQQLIVESMRRHEQLDNTAIQVEIQDCIGRIQDRDRESRVVANAQAIAAAFSAGDREKARQLLNSLQSDTISQD